MRTKIPIW